MASTREIRRRIKSVRSTRQITKAMELVAASKMRRASEATLSSRPYAERSWQIVQDIVSNPQEEISHPLLQKRPVKNSLIVAIASDRGLAGVYNTAIVKKAQELLAANQAQGRHTSFITMGKKIEQGLMRLNQPVLQSYAHVSTHPSSEELWPLGNYLIHGFLKGDFDEVQVVYTSFHSLLSQEATFIKILPLEPIAMPERPQSSEFIYEPSPAEVLDKLLPRLVEVQLYQCLLESLASEHAARRLSMKSATDNANTVIDDLTLTYNGLRQGAITQEIAEITSGAAALTN